MSNPTEKTVTSQVELAKVGVRVPPFCPDDPALWFAQIEGQFALAGISADTTKFYYVSAQLEHQYAMEVKDVITNPPADDKYGKLKAELIKRLSASQEKKVKQLLTHEELGDRKPSQFLRHLQTLAGPAVPEDFLRTLWAGRLPTNIQTVVAAAQRKMSLEDVAELADQVYDIAPNTPQVATTSANVSVVEMSKQISELSRQVASLQSQLNNNNNGGRSRSQNRNNNRNFRNRSRSKSHDPSVCWYHNRFGNRATKCTEPCNFKSSGNAAGSRK